MPSGSSGPSTVTFANMTASFSNWLLTTTSALKGRQPSRGHRCDQVERQDRVVRFWSCKPMQIPDVERDPTFEFCRRSDYALSFAVPLLREKGYPLGRLTMWRETVSRAFTRSADQTGRDLCRSGRDRHRECAAVPRTQESLEQQTATSEIFGVIASSPTDIQPVLDAVAENAARLCDATDASNFASDGDRLRHAASLWTLPIPAENLTYWPRFTQWPSVDRPADNPHP